MGWSLRLQVLTVVQIQGNKSLKLYEYYICRTNVVFFLKTDIQIYKVTVLRTLVISDSLNTVTCEYLIKIKCTYFTYMNCIYNILFTSYHVIILGVLLMKI